MSLAGRAAAAVNAAGITEPVPSEHVWFACKRGLESCAWCGVMRNPRGHDEPCPGIVRVELRTEDEAPSEGPVVINRHHHGGRSSSFPTPWIYIGRGSALGNPFTKAEHGEDALELYRKWLWDKIRGRDRDVLDMLATITSEHHLVCSCKPRPCHGDVVVNAWRWLEERRKAHQDGRSEEHQDGSSGEQ